MAISDILQLDANARDEFRNRLAFGRAGQVADVLAGDGRRFDEQAVHFGQGFVGRRQRIVTVPQVGTELILLLQRSREIKHLRRQHRILARRDELPTGGDARLLGEHFQLAPLERTDEQVRTEVVRDARDINGADGHSLRLPVAVTGSTSPVH